MLSRSKQPHSELQRKDSSKPVAARFFCAMRRNTVLVRTPVALCAILAAAMQISGCDKNELAPFDAPRNSPFLETAAVSPNAVNLDLLTPSNGVYLVAATVQVRATAPTAKVKAVTADVVRPGGETPFASFTLRDDGVAPDVSASDNTYSGEIRFSVQRSSTGAYRIRLLALGSTGLYSNLLEKSLTISRSNSPPFLSHVVAPDTVVLPAGGALDIHISIAAADSDGLADIQQVYFRSLASSSPDFKFYLKDDGGADPPGAPFFLASSDSVAGDAIYSVLIPLRDSPTVRRTNIFAFQAVDTYGDTSATVLHYLTVR